jgi:hypothetical protein
MWFSNLQQFHDDFELEERPHFASVIIMEFITDDS